MRLSQKSVPPEMGEAAPRDRILIAAERAFAESGIEGASLRAITTAASVNIAAVNYYFGSKEALVHAVLDRLAARINARRMARLDALFAEGAPMPTLAQVIEVFIAPYVRPETRQEGDLLLKLLLQHRSAPTDITRRIISEHFNPLSKRFIEALKTLLPDIPETDLAWRYFFLVGAVLFGVSETGAGGRIGMVTGGKADPQDIDALVRQLSAFLEAGVSAPPASQE